MPRLSLLQQLETFLYDSVGPWRLLVGGLAAAGIGLGLVWAASTGSQRADAPDPPGARIARVEADLAASRAENQRLLAELAQTRQELAAAEAAAEWTALADAAVTRAHSSEDEAPAAGPQRPGFDDAALVAAGLHHSDAEALRALWQDGEAAKAELTVRAEAEGWARSYRHHQALREVENEIRAELADDDYDRFLYATGRPNSLVVQQVLDDSPAEYAGLQAGDRILRFDGQRLFSAAELHSAVAAGEPTQVVRLEVARGDTELSITVPREPLGVLAAVKRDAPARP